MGRADGFCRAFATPAQSWVRTRPGTSCMGQRSKSPYGCMTMTGRPMMAASRTAVVELEAQTTGAFSSSSAMVAMEMRIFEAVSCPRSSSSFSETGR